jgi:SAM-dependent methyltransferase
VTSYWTTRGVTYEQTYIQTEERRLQEQAVRRVLGGLEYGSVLDVGCGFGRYAPLVGGTSYTGIDLSADMLRSAREKRPDGRFVRVPLDAFAPSHQYDLVLAIEVLMHLSPKDVADAIAKLRRLARHNLVTVDWSKPLPSAEQQSHNWVHDYRTLYGEALIREVPVAYQSLYHVAP